MQALVHGWKVWGWKVQGWSLKSPGLKCPANQFPALFANQNVFEFRSAVSGDHDYKFNFEYELDKRYHTEICQSKEAGNVTFNIFIDGQKVHSTINTDPGAILLLIISSKLIHIMH